MPANTTRKRVRALYLQPAPLFGGAERQAALAAALLPQFGVDVIPLVGPGRVISDWLRECGVRDIHETQYFPGGWKKQRGLRRATLPYRYVDCGLRARAEIQSLVTAERADIILASLPFAWITGSLVARQANIPIVWRAGGTHLNAAQRAALWGLTRFQQPDLLLCNSEAVKATFSPLVPAPVEVVPNGIDERRFHPGAGDALRYRPRDAAQVVGCAMRLAEAKRPRDFVALAAALAVRRPEVRLLLAGEGTERAELERMARQSGAHNLTFLGFVADMPSFYAACDLLVLPSSSEGCSNFVLEATALGKPVVVADIPPLLELVAATRNAVCFELGNVPALVAAVSQLLGEPERLAALGAQALEHADRFTARATAARIAALLRLLVLERRGKPSPSPAKRLPPSRRGPDDMELLAK